MADQPPSCLQTEAFSPPTPRPAATARADPLEARVADVERRRIEAERDQARRAYEAASAKLGVRPDPGGQGGCWGRFSFGSGAREGLTEGRGARRVARGLWAPQRLDCLGK